MFICSTENLRQRDDAEVAYLMRVIEEVVAARLARREARWQVHVAGMLDAVRDLLTEADGAGVPMADLAANLTTEDISAHLYTAGRSGPDLVIRTSGEQRLSNFLL